MSLLNLSFDVEGGGVDSIHLFKELFFTIKTGHLGCLRVLSRGHRGHPCKLGNLGETLQKNGFTKLDDARDHSPVFTTFCVYLSECVW